MGSLCTLLPPNPITNRESTPLFRGSDFKMVFFTPKITKSEHQPNAIPMSSSKNNHKNAQIL